ncbi:hypothetical protein [Mycetocola miduiensis]|uniref:Antitoxin VbhA domain-containing protein n=1 Tax=Mycetocola miduiensis TaxID=995034 RepID=A0A1I5B9D3_9MICO|nr:hypothetical protein [Mycetocola miduiensis]SFN71161.1 hypothetical protein SAMN05216219_1814 [Mycetocola miduiensis]
MAENSTPPKRPTEAEIDAEMARIDGINGSAGHRLEDPYLRDLMRKQIAGDITGDEARELGMEHLRKQVKE